MPRTIKSATPLKYNTVARTIRANITTGKWLPGQQIPTRPDMLSHFATGMATLQRALDELNPEMPHYKQVRAFVVQEEAFSIENGCMTVNGKLKRDAIAARLKPEIEEMYRVKQAV